jgi:hypothetical protein
MWQTQGDQFEQGKGSQWPEDATEQDDGGATSQLIWD